MGWAVWFSSLCVSALLLQVNALQLLLGPSSVTVGDTFLVKWTRNQVGDPDQFPLNGVNASGGVGTLLGLATAFDGALSGNSTYLATTPGPFHVVAFTGQDDLMPLASSNQITILPASSPNTNPPSQNTGNSNPSSQNTGKPPTNPPNTSTTTSTTTSSSQTTSLSTESQSFTTQSNSTTSTPPPLWTSQTLSATSPTSDAAPSSTAQVLGTTSKSSTPIIIGVVVAVFVVAAVLAFIFIRRRTRKSKLPISTPNMLLTPTSEMSLVQDTSSPLSLVPPSGAAFRSGKQGPVAARTSTGDLSYVNSSVDNEPPPQYIQHA